MTHKKCLFTLERSREQAFRLSVKRLSVFFVNVRSSQRKRRRITTGTYLVGAHFAQIAQLQHFDVVTVHFDHAFLIINGQQLPNHLSLLSVDYFHLEKINGMEMNFT